MAWVSLLTGILMLFIFRLASNQGGIKKTKDRIKAHLLELRLFKDNIGETLKAQGNIFRYNLKYIAYSARPMLVMIIPLVLILAQLNLWFGYQSLRVGQDFLLKVKLGETADPLGSEIILEAPTGIGVETPALRLEEAKEIDWRLRAQFGGIHFLTIKLGGQSFTKSVSVGQSPVSKISALKVGRRFLDQALNPGEKPLPAGLPIKSVEISYPVDKMKILGLNLHWLVVYFVFSIAFGFALKRPFKVEI